MPFELSSIAFEQGQAIPKQATADGQNVSPPFQWSDAPEATRSFALICEDHDAPRGTFTHWILFNIPADSRELGEGIPAALNLPNGTAQGTNDFGKTGYGGPSPPPGKPHRYFFRLYALDRALHLSGGATKDQLLSTIKGHVLADADLMGIYGR